MSSTSPAALAHPSPAQSRRSSASVATRTSLPSVPPKADSPPTLALASREPRTAGLSPIERLERLEASYGLGPHPRVEGFEQVTPSRLDALEQAIQRKFEQQTRMFVRRSQLLDELEAHDANQLSLQKDRIFALWEDITALKKDVAALAKDTATMREQASALKATCDGIADLVVPAQSWLTRKDPAGDIVRVEKQVELLTKAQKDANLKQRMILHLVHDDFADALHAAALEYHAALPAYLARLCDVNLASDDEKAEVLEAKHDWERLVQRATGLRDDWVVKQQKKRSLTSLAKEDRLVWQKMDLLRGRDELRSFFQKRGVDTWALMLWSASRDIKNLPIAASRHGQSHPNPSVETAVAIFRPYLSGFGSAAPEGTAPLTTLFRGLGAVQVTPIGAPARPAFGSEGVLQSVDQEGLGDKLRVIFGEARALWKSWVESPAVLA